MVNISKKSVKKETLNTISKNLINYIANIKTPIQAENFLNELLTNSERIMLAKRLAIIIMLERKYNFEAIKTILKVSPSTVARIQEDREQGKFDFIIEEVLTKKSYKPIKAQSSDEGFIAAIEVLLRAGMPPITGPGRWKKTLEILDEQKRKYG